MKFFTFLFPLMISALVTCRPLNPKSDVSLDLAGIEQNDITKPADDASIANGRNIKPSDEPPFPSSQGKTTSSFSKRGETDNDQDWNLVEGLQKGQKKGEVEGYWKEYVIPITTTRLCLSISSPYTGMGSDNQNV